MGTFDNSRIVNARTFFACAECGCQITKGTQYFRYQIGQRRSLAYCIECARTDVLVVDGDGVPLHRPHAEVYAMKYGTIKKHFPRRAR